MLHTIPVELYMKYWQILFDHRTKLLLNSKGHDTSPDSTQLLGLDPTKQLGIRLE